LVSGGEEMGLVPSKNRENLGEAVVATMPVFISHLLAASRQADLNGELCHAIAVSGHESVS
jgi:hypothetical protein